MLVWLAEKPAGSFDGIARLWDLKASRAVWTADFRDGVEGVAFSSDSRLFAAGSWDGTIKILEVDSGKESSTLTGHKAGVIHVAFSPDGRTLASAADDSTVRLWNLVTGREITRLNSVNSVRFLGFSSDGETLAVGGTSNIVHLLRAPPM